MSRATRYLAFAALFTVTAAVGAYRILHDPLSTDALLLLGFCVIVWIGAAFSYVSLVRDEQHDDEAQS